MRIGRIELTREQFNRAVQMLKDRTRIDSTGCWIYTGRLRNGYGVIDVKSQLVAAHRLAYRLHHGLIGDEMFVCHTCDTPPCVNPDHLWQGTVTENNRDRDTKGRGRPPLGSNNGNSKLIKEDVIEILHLCHDGFDQEHIAEMFGITVTYVRCIWARKQWKHVTTTWTP